MNNIGLEVVFWTVLSLYLLAKTGVFKKSTRKRRLRKISTLSGGINKRTRKMIQ